MEIRLCAFADEASANLDEQIRQLNLHSIPYLELRGVNGKNVSDCTVEDAKHWKKKLDEGGIRVWSIGSPIGKIGINDDFDEHLKKAENVFRIANVLGCDKIRAFSFFTSNYEQDKEIVFARLNALVSLADKYGVTLYHENEKEIWGDMASRCVEILDNVKGIKSVFDPANYVQCDQNIDDALEILQHRTDYYHIKDALYGSGMVVPAGEGDGKIEKMVSGIDKDTTLTLEPHLRVFEGYGSIDSTELKNKHCYATSFEAFAAAVNAIKTILRNQGFEEENSVWKK